MKFLIVAATVATALSLGPGPAFAVDTSWAIPKVCNLAKTKADHPNWYRDGGYCEAQSFDDETPPPAKPAT